MIIFLDACAVIYWVEAVDEWFSRLQMTIGAVSKDRAMFAVSMLSLLECTVKPMRDGNQDILARYRRFFTRPDLRKVLLSVPVLERATELRAHLNLKTPDALQAACALSITGKTVFLTNDICFERVPGLRVVVID
jgi:predicted nucleic acid-binding protein